MVRSAVVLCKDLNRALSWDLADFRGFWFCSPAVATGLVPF